MAATSGATALVPPTTMGWPSTTTCQPVYGSAQPATLGTPRPLPPGTPALACQAGRANIPLTPPPVAPPLVPSFHTTSELGDRVGREVPPHPTTWGEEAG